MTDLSDTSALQTLRDALGEINDSDVPDEQKAKAVDSVFDLVWTSNTISQCNQQRALELGFPYALSRLVGPKSSDSLRDRAFNLLGTLTFRNAVVAESLLLQKDLIKAIVETLMSGDTPLFVKERAVYLLSNLAALIPKLPDSNLLDVFPITLLPAVTFTLTTSTSDTLKASCVSFMQNLSNKPSMRAIMRTSGSVESLVEIMQSENIKAGAGGAALAVAKLVGHSESHSAFEENNPTTARIMQLLVLTLNCALHEKPIPGTSTVPGLAGITSALNVLCSSGRNKRSLDTAGLMPELCGGICKVVDGPAQGMSTAGVAMLSTLWHLSFVPSFHKNILDNKPLMKILEDLRTDESAKSDARAAACGVVWQLTKQHYTKSDRAGGRFVLISHSQENDSPRLGQLKTALQGAGCDIRSTPAIPLVSPSLVNAMANSVVHSKAVLLCLSNEYKTNPQCRAEAEFAVLHNRRLIPLIVEEGYRPDGWLKTALGNATLVDYSNPKSIDSRLKALVKQLKPEKSDKEKDRILAKHEVGEEKVDECEGSKFTSTETAKQYLVPRAIRYPFASWNEEEVVSWLEKKGVSGGSKLSAKSIDGECLNAICLFTAKEQSEFFNAELGLTTREALKTVLHLALLCDGQRGDQKL